jgi:hypothetical protein
MVLVYFGIFFMPEIDKWLKLESAVKPTFSVKNGY